MVQAVFFTLLFVRGATKKQVAQRNGTETVVLFPFLFLFLLPQHEAAQEMSRAIPNQSRADKGVSS
jgi:hypothetical protein